MAGTAQWSPPCDAIRLRAVARRLYIHAANARTDAAREHDVGPSTNGFPRFDARVTSTRMTEGAPEPKVRRRESCGLPATTTSHEVWAEWTTELSQRPDRAFARVGRGDFTLTTAR
jgi:hypothetical protein